jgi:hypothetical protein
MVLYESGMEEKRVGNGDQMTIWKMMCVREYDEEERWLFMSGW